MRNYISVILILSSFLCTTGRAESKSSEISREGSVVDNLKTETELQEELWPLVRSLSKLRTDYYEKQKQYAEKLKQINDSTRTLKTKVEELRKSKENIDQKLDQTQTHINKLESEIKKYSVLKTAANQKLQSFISEQKQEVEKGIPYRKEVRLSRLDSEIKDIPFSDSFAKIWNFTQEEMRIARSGQTYTDQVQLDKGRKKYARIFHAGLLISGYITEQGGQSGIWVNGSGWQKATKSEADSIKQVINILDRKQAPKYIKLPLYTTVKTEQKSTDK